MEFAGIFDRQFGQFCMIPANLLLFEIQKVTFLAKMSNIFDEKLFYSKIFIIL
jgi:hypothetical protein